ncbi:hypothetical protein NX059_006461 [Plenodomus lindquistii]|nr:hypothetical protein NX059_006461 [Plenodomus lindquistii]
MRRRLKTSKIAASFCFRRLRPAFRAASLASGCVRLSVMHVRKEGLEQRVHSTKLELRCGVEPSPTSAQPSDLLVPVQASARLEFNDNAIISNVIFCSADICLL